MVQVAVTSVSFSKNDELVRVLKSKYPEARINTDGHKLVGTELINYLSSATGAIIGTEIIDERVLESLPELKVIAKYGVGMDNLDTELLDRYGVHLGWTGGVNRRSVSELALCACLGLARNIFFSGQDLKQGSWNKAGGFELTGKTVGIVGCGNIGSDLLKLIQPFGCEILINDILDKQEVAEQFNGKQVAFDDLLRHSDIISIHTPLTELTRNLIGRRELELMSTKSFLINTARGEIVNQDELKKALIERSIAGAFLDVFSHEPPTDEEFLRLSNLMVTPHIGGNSKEAILAMGTAAISNLEKNLNALNFQ